MLYSDWLKCVNPPMLLFIIHDGKNEVTITPSMGVIGIKKNSWETLTLRRRRCGSLVFFWCFFLFGLSHSQDKYNREFIHIYE